MTRDNKQQGTIMYNSTMLVGITCTCMFYYSTEVVGWVEIVGKGKGCKAFQILENQNAIIIIQ